MLTSTGIRYEYDSGTVVAPPDVLLKSGQHVLVLGPSGSGKSTLLGLWSGLLTPTAGEVTVGDTRVDALRGSARDHWRGTNVGFVYQSPRLIASQRVAENIELPGRLSAKPISRNETLAAMEELGIAHLADRYPDACSLGERQRIGILRAVAHAPTLILADEPTSALDRDNALAVAKLLKARASRTDATLAVVTHDDRLADLFEHTIYLPTARA